MVTRLASRSFDIQSHLEAVGSGNNLFIDPDFTAVIHSGGLRIERAANGGGFTRPDCRCRKAARKVTVCQRLWGTFLRRERPGPDTSPAIS
jgi:hypothetical protein